MERGSRLYAPQVNICLSIVLMTLTGLASETTAPFQKLWIGSGTWLRVGLIARVKA